MTLQISVNGKLSPATSLAIAPDAGSSACVIPGYTTAQLQSLDNGKTITTGGFTITQFSINVPSFGNAKFDSIAGGFTQLNGFQLASAAQANPRHPVRKLPGDSIDEQRIDGLRGW